MLNCLILAVCHFLRRKKCLQNFYALKKRMLEIVDKNASEIDIAW